MASDCFRLHLPDRRPVNRVIAKFSLLRSRDCSTAVRRAKVIGCLAELRQKDRNSFSRTVGKACKAMFAASGGGSITFGLSEAKGTRCLDARIFSEVADSPETKNETKALVIGRLLDHLNEELHNPRPTGFGRRSDCDCRVHGPRDVR